MALSEYTDEFLIRTRHKKKIGVKSSSLFIILLHDDF
jgi:hypothetical protein